LKTGSTAFQPAQDVQEGLPRMKPNAAIQYHAAGFVYPAGHKKPAAVNRIMFQPVDI
jgi:hypothetical protein